MRSACERTSWRTPDVVSTNRALSALGRNLLAGARLASFRSIERGDFRVDAAQLLLFLVVSALVDNATDWLRHGPDAALDGSAAGAELASFALLVAIAALVERRSKDAVGLR